MFIVCALIRFSLNLLQQNIEKYSCDSSLSIAGVSQSPEDCVKNKLISILMLKIFFFKKCLNTLKISENLYLCEKQFPIYACI